MLIDVFRPFLSLILALSLVPSLAHGHDRSRCESVLVAELRSSTVSPRWFQSPTRNKFLTRLNRQNLREISVPAVRHQCLETCYYQAAHVSIESELREMKALASNELLSGFVNQMKIAWIRYQGKKKRGVDLSNLLASGNYEGFAVLLRGPSFIIDASDIEAMHGTQYVSDLEEYLLAKQNPESILNYDRKKIKALLDLPFDEFVEAVRKIEEDYLSKIAEKAVRFRPLKVREVRLHSVENLDYGSAGRLMVQTHMELSKSDAFKITATPYGLAKILRIKDPRPIFADFAQTIDAGQAVKVGLSHLYRQSQDDIHHAVALIGYYKNSNGQLEGFKFMNSWGLARHAGGFGYISVDQLYTYLLTGESIAELILDKR